MSTYSCKGPIDRPHLLFLHGFLGSKEDWDPIIELLSSHYFCCAIDYPFSEEKNAKLSLKKPVLVGYSMGGRIAMQLYRAFPHQWSGLVLLSAHPGLNDPKEREQRVSQDGVWAKKLQELPFEHFLRLWYAQPIFQSLAKKPDLLEQIIEKRKEQDTSRLAHILLENSLGYQEPMVDFPPRTLALFGEEDLKYAAIYTKLPSTLKTVPISHAGHAIHLESPAGCARAIHNWMEEKYATDPLEHMR